MVGYCCVTMLLQVAFLVSLIGQGLCALSAIDQEVFYVKPAEPETDCPPGDRPCQPLQDYVDQSDFTSNRMFRFLEGKHHLYSKVSVSAIANLSLIGEITGVEILCKSTPSGFEFENVAWLNIENLAIFDCSVDDPSVSVEQGSEVILTNLTFSNSLPSTRVLIARDVSGLLSITNSVFYGGIEVYLGACSGPSNFMYSNNILEPVNGFMLMYLRALCRNYNMDIAITDSSFGSNNMESSFPLEICSWNNYSLLVNNSIFKRVHIYSRCPGIENLDANDLHDGQNSMNKFTGITMINSSASFTMFYDSPTNESRFLIQDSTFSDYSNSNQHLLELSYRRILTGETLKATLSNVFFFNNNAKSQTYLNEAEVLFDDCTFQNNVGTAIYALASKVIFQETNTFRNNSAVIGGGMQLRSSSYMYLQPNTSVLFEDNHADYVGGAVYIDHEEQDAGCFFHAESSASGTIEVKFANNSANYSGSSMYGNGIALCCDDSNCNNFFDIFDISNSEADPSAIGSDPDKVCLCGDKRQPDCSLRDYSTEVGLST